MNNEEEKITDTINTIVDGVDDNPPKENDNELFTKSEVDKYIQETINQRWDDKVSMEREEKLARLKKEEDAIDSYTETMKQSDEPWVDLKGYTESSNGLKISLDWNDAFIVHLRESGMKGIDDEQIVHMWLSLLMKEVATDTTKGSEFED